LIRGLPGSGKTTLASHLCDEYTYLTEADGYFYDDYGNYMFDANNLKEAHDWCQKDAKGLLDAGYNVVVANTFTTPSEMKPYYLMAKELGVKLNIITCQGDFGNVHNVPESTLDKMKKRFFHGDVIAELDRLYGV
jgi:predicted kinase